MKTMAAIAAAFAIAIAFAGCATTQQPYLGLAEGASFPHDHSQLLAAPLSDYGEVSEVSETPYAVYVQEKAKGNVLFEEYRGRWIYFCSEIDVEVVPTHEAWTILERQKTRKPNNPPEDIDACAPNPQR